MKQYSPEEQTKCSLENQEPTVEFNWNTVKWTDQYYVSRSFKMLDRLNNGQEYVVLGIEEARSHINCLLKYITSGEAHTDDIKLYGSLIAHLTSSNRCTNNSLSDDQVGTLSSYVQTFFVELVHSRLISPCCTVAFHSVEDVLKTIKEAQQIYWALSFILLNIPQLLESSNKGVGFLIDQSTLALMNMVRNKNYCSQSIFFLLEWLSMLLRSNQPMTLQHRAVLSKILAECDEDSLISSYIIQMYDLQ